MLTETGFVDIEIGPPVDTFGDARGEANARTFKVYGYAFLAHKRGLGQRTDGSSLLRRDP
jgi:hypothetical protein